MKTAMCALASVALLLAGCSDEKGAGAESIEASPAAVAVEFPDGDPAVAAEEGGPGFSPSPASGWQTDEDFPLEGSLQAQRGGSVRYWVRFPLTARTSTQSRGGRSLARTPDPSGVLLEEALGIPAGRARSRVS